VECLFLFGIGIQYSFCSSLRKPILQLRDTVSERQKVSRFILTHSVVYTLKLRKSFFLNISHTYCLQFTAWAIYYQVTRGARIEEFRVEILYKKLWKLLIDRQVQRKLIGFRFTCSLNHNLPAKRLKAQEAFLLRRTT
jgi:hypothetical protein